MNHRHHHHHHHHPNGESPLDDNEEVLLGTDYVVGDFPPFKVTPTSHAVMTKPEWEDPYAMSNNPNDSSGTSPLTTSQGVSPPGPNDMSSFPFGDPDQSLSSISDVLQEEKDFMAYVMSFPSTVPSVPPQELLKKSQPDAKVGLDHLDNLCKLMEQLSDLKETNIKLRRRVQYLEDIKTLHEIHKEMVGERKLYSSGLSEDEVQQLKNKLGVESEPSEESFDDHIHLEPPAEEQLHGLYRSKTANQIGEYNSKVENTRGHKSRCATASKERRERSKSVGHPGHSKNKKRPSRWSKVKEVLGIERNDEGSAEGASDAQGGMVGPQLEERVQVVEKGRGNHKDSEQSKAYKLSCSKSHSSVLSSRSFSEAERQSCTTPVDLAKKSGTLDSKTAQAAMESLEKEMAIKKSPKTPWGKMKTMIQIRRDNRHQKSESSSSSPRDAKPTKSSEATNGHSPRRNQRNSHRSSYGDTGINSAAGESSHNSHHGDRQHQRLDVAYPGEHRHRQKSPKSPSRKSSVPQLESEGKARLERDPDPTQRCRQDELDAYLGLREPTIPKEGTKRKKSKSRPPPLDYPPPCDPPMDMSPSAHKKWMWTRVKDALKGAGGKRGEEEDGHFSLSAPSSPASDAIAFDFDIDKAKEESFPKPPGGGPRGSEGGGEPLLLGSNHPSATVAELMLELQQNLSDDFNKKLEEWQRCRMGEGVHKPPTEVERKDSFGRVRKVSKPEKKMSTGEKLTKSTHHLPKKDLSWLEKEQQKVDREIIRLSKEKQKFEKRSFHLKQLKESLTDVDGGPKREVFVKTSAGEFRFEGISDAFTKKLYEWEAKKGVVSPELSTIALLDESLKPMVEVSAPTAASVGSNSTRTSPEPPKSCYQVSRASSEPDLSTTQKDSGTSNQGTMRSKSGDTLLTGEIEVASLEGETICKLEPETRYPIHHSEDNYYSLLEENMYLIDQLKDKEEICSYLQNELERLDDKTEKANRTHQEEMENYRQKLWEIHMSRPRDLQGSLHLISELKSRIEELQKCSDELKSDRERLEESFRYHSNQQARLADDLIRKVREMQITNTSFGFSRGGSRRKWRKYVKCDPISITRMHDLSTQLLQQVRDIEQMLMERTRQVCHLRWELLHRDMSAVLLQAALHRVTSQGEPVSILPTWDKRRNRFKNIKAWSVDTTTRRPSEDLVTDDWLQERLRQLSMTPYNDWTNIDFSPNDLMTTAHELKKEALRLSVSRPDSTSYEGEEKKSGVCSAESEMADSDRCYDTGSAVNSRSSSFSSGGAGGLRGSHSDTRLYERSRALRRGSSSSMSCVENSDSSSFHDSSDRMQVRRFPPWRPQWRSVENVSSSCSSRSSILDDEMRSQWRPSRSNRNAEAMSLEDTPHLQQKYGSFRETDEENEESRIPPSMEWGSQCLITPKPIHLAAELGRGETSSPDSTRNYSPHVGRGYSYSRIAKPSYAEMRDFRLPRSTIATVDVAKPLALAEDGLHRYQEGSMESLDKYETAIRDEELTVSDEYDRPKAMQSFYSFEEDLKQRTLKQSSSVVHVPHNCIADYIDKERQQGATSADYHGKQSSTPGSPNISKFKYKGTKGFGRSSRIGLSKSSEEKTSFKGFKDSEIQHVDI